VGAGAVGGKCTGEEGTCEGACTGEEGTCDGEPNNDDFLSFYISELRLVILIVFYNSKA